jgi:hypothetical protein
MAEGAAAEQQPVVSPTTVWVEWLATAEKGMRHNFFANYLGLAQLLVRVSGVSKYVS